MATQITLPKDAEGREIPLDTSELFISDGTMVHAVRFEYIYHTCDARGTWFVYIVSTPGEHITLQACDVYLTKPDSWKKLEDDLDKCISSNDSCCYFSKSGMCCDCTIDSSSIDYKCDSLVFNSIKERIHKLKSKG